MVGPSVPPRTAHDAVYAELEVRRQAFIKNPCNETRFNLRHQLEYIREVETRPHELAVIEAICIAINELGLFLEQPSSTTSYIVECIKCCQSGIDDLGYICLDCNGKGYKNIQEARKQADKESLMRRMLRKLVG